jgi:hypothetical protein
MKETHFRFKYFRSLNANIRIFLHKYCTVYTPYAAFVFCKFLYTVVFANAAWLFAQTKEIDLKAKYAGNRKGIRDYTVRGQSNVNIDLSPPHRTASVYPPPPPAFGAGGGHSRWVERRWGVNNSEDARHCSVLHICKYFVQITDPK